VAQAPPVQTWPALQVVPHAPQFCGSVWRFVQKAPAPVPQASGVEAGQAQALFTQAWPTGQATPHPPQLAGSFPRLAQ
jgi:hypothetical protein